MPNESHHSFMPAALKLALGVYIGSLSFGLIYLLVKVWPSGLTSEPGFIHLSQDGRYLVSAALAGALGSYIHLATSFIDYAGRRTLTSSWAWWYFLRPWIGAALALVVYFVIRAGLITGAGEAATANLNPYGIASLAALSGMFSRQATEKLRDVFENVCATNHEKGNS